MRSRSWQIAMMILTLLCTVCTQGTPHSAAKERSTSSTVALLSSDATKDISALLETLSGDLAAAQTRTVLAQKYRALGYRTMASFFDSTADYARTAQISPWRDRIEGACFCKVSDTSMSLHEA